MKNSFERGPDGWCSYDYHASVVAGQNIFILTAWEPRGGISDSGYVWANETRWSADTPEKPLSILPLLLYRSWIGDGPVDLREAEVSVYLRGDELKLDGAECFFWVHAAGTRWHFTSNPIEISHGCWASKPSGLTLKNDESLWHQSWAKDPDSAPSLDEVLRNAHSYGFSFVGFSSEVSGKLSMDEFALKPSVG
jgi:hypothetical protein